MIKLSAVLIAAAAVIIAGLMVLHEVRHYATATEKEAVGAAYQGEDFGARATREQQTECAIRHTPGCGRW